METIKGIGFENFRVFNKSSDFELAPVTILTGSNSSGKSTIIKGLKLLQGYWNNPNGQSYLHFEGGAHQLGDYEMALSNDSDSEEFVVRYHQEHILFGKITVENRFELDESNTMKNGMLKSSTIFYDARGTMKELYKTYREGDQVHYCTSTDEIINILIPELKGLYEEQKLYRKKVRKYIKRIPDKTSKNNGEIEDFGDYLGPAKYNEFSDYKAHPVINRKFCHFLGVDYERFKALDRFGGVFNDGVVLSFTTSGKVNRLKPAYAEYYDPNSYIYGANSKLLKLIARVPVEQYDNLEIILLGKILEEYPEVVNRFNEASFEEMKLLLKKHVKDSFDKFYRELENKVLIEQNNYVESVKSQIAFKFGSKNVEIKLHLNKGFHIDENKMEFFGGDSIQEQPYNDKLNQLFDYIGRLEKELFGSFDKSSPTNLLIKMIKEELDGLTYQSIKNFSKKTRFIESVRANTQRLYTHTSQGTPFNSLLINYMRKHNMDSSNKFLNKWVRNFEIGDSVEFKVVEGVGTQVYILKGDKKTNLVDMGYGVTQLLPILMEISAATSGETIVIEEPETNLHPKLQSKMADMFIDACKSLQIRFIVETHSEYLVRKLQYLTAKREISADETIIHYIDNKDQGKRSYVTDPQVRTIKIKKDGALSQPFGAGFFDEADNLAMELWSFTNN